MRWTRLVWSGLAIVCLPLAAVAHPLGNFTTNQYVGLHLTQDTIEVDYVLDLAEIPATQARRGIDADGDDVVDEGERASFEKSECEAAGSELSLSLDGEPARLSVVASQLGFPEGEAGLSTLRLECRLRAEPGVTRPTRVEFANPRYEDRQGWSELVLTTSGVAAETDVPERSRTSRLRTYPEDRLSSPVEIDEGTATAQPDPDASAGEPPPMPGATEGGGRSTPVDALASLVDPRRGSPALPVAMVVALGLGVLHALAPGHGKTVMAAYLVGSGGTVGQAVGLGVAVALSHTVGVLGLGLVTLVGTTAFSPERVFPVLSVVSGIVVVGIGVWMMARWLRSRPGVDHGHPGHSHSHEGARAGTHSHGGSTHSHVVPSALEGASGWRVLASMGLAGGLVPSTSAVVLLLASVNLGRIPLGLLLIALFGLGMATTLVGVGFGLVKAGQAGMDRFGDARWVRTGRRLLTPVSATVVVVVGVFLTITA